jgi:hypothetical protein
LFFAKWGFAVFLKGLSVHVVSPVGAFHGGELAGESVAVIAGYLVIGGFGVGVGDVFAEAGKGVAEGFVTLELDVGGVVVGVGEDFGYAVGFSVW